MQRQVKIETLLQHLAASQPQFQTGRRRENLWVTSHLVPLVQHSARPDQEASVMNTTLTALVVTTENMTWTLPHILYPKDVIPGDSAYT